MVLTKGRWQDALNGFADLVKNGEYSKMDYPIWQRIRKWNYDITIWSNSNDVIVFPCESYNVIDTEVFSKRDGSFGQYLKEHWLDAEVIYNTCSDGSLTAAKADYMQSDSTTLNSVNVNTITLDDYYYTAGTSNSSYIHIDADDVRVGSISVVDKFNELEAKIDTKQDKLPTEKEKENKNMNMFKGFDFGRVDGSTVRMSMYGLAIKNQAGVWVSYNVATNEIIDVDVLNFNGEQFMYKMPVAIDQIHTGDTIIHNRKPMFVGEVTDDGKMIVIDVFEGEEKMILPTKNMFGFNFATKVVSLMDMAGMNKPNAENPFGNMWMLAMMGDGKDINFKDIMLMQMMSGQGNSNMNPMMAMMLMGENNEDNLMMAMAMSGMFNNM
jgi:hypothetical protein